jgi:hypothetical protein
VGLDGARSGRHRHRVSIYVHVTRLIVVPQAYKVSPSSIVPYVVVLDAGDKPWRTLAAFDDLAEAVKFAPDQGTERVVS